MQTAISDDGDRTAPERRPASGVGAAAPCPTCGCAVFYLDAYGNHHCGQCSPPLVTSMARTWLVVAHEAAGTTTWEKITPGSRWPVGGAA